MHSFEDNRDHKRLINKSEVSIKESSKNDGSRSRSGRRRYRSKSEDVSEKRRNDPLTEELDRITRGVTLKNRKKKKVKVRLGSLTRIEVSRKDNLKKPKLHIQTADL